MNAFLVNLLLALVWAGLSGEFTVLNFLIGFGLGYLVLGLLRPVAGSAAYFATVPRIVRFARFFLWQLLLSNLRVAYDVITPRHRTRPGVIAIPLDADSDAEIVTLANLITLTPGTLSLDVSTDRKVLYIHAMYIGDIEAFRQQIKQGVERRVLEVLR